MRHIGSLLAGLVVAPLAWVLIAAGQPRVEQTFERWSTADSIYTGDVLGPLGLVLGAGLLVGLVVALRLSPLGPLVAGAFYLGVYGWAIREPVWVVDKLPQFSINGYRIDTVPPFANGTIALAGAILVTAALSRRRWQRWPAPVAAEAPAAGPVAGGPVAGEPAAAGAGTLEFPAVPEPAAFTPNEVAPGPPPAVGDGPLWPSTVGAGPTYAPLTRETMYAGLTPGTPEDLPRRTPPKRPSTTDPGGDPSATSPAAPGDPASPAGPASLAGPESPAGPDSPTGLYPPAGDPGPPAGRTPPTPLIPSPRHAAPTEGWPLDTWPGTNPADRPTIQPPADRPLAQPPADPPLPQPPANQPLAQPPADQPLGQPPANQPLAQGGSDDRPTIQPTYQVPPDPPATDLTQALSPSDLTQPVPPPGQPTTGPAGQPLPPASQPPPAESAPQPTRPVENDEPTRPDQPSDLPWLSGQGSQPDQPDPTGPPPRPVNPLAQRPVSPPPAVPPRPRPVNPLSTRPAPPAMPADPSDSTQRLPGQPAPADGDSDERSTDPPAASPWSRPPRPPQET